MGWGEAVPVPGRDRRGRRGRAASLIALVALVVAAAAASGCAVVPKNRRQYLADPTMQPNESRLRGRASAKMHTAREGAAGGDGEPAGGGCGCSN
ncbi:MAG TPA: DUF4266 domain-containing protein [Kofleriaceae bacterium]|nr:DUF4266 domain-containing protein [Kofleriaceae bacterium]